ncbi:hypothetical protein ILUMI_18716, partial [Ignelater luminosus]
GKFERLLFVLLRLPIETLLQEADRQKIPLSFMLGGDESKEELNRCRFLTACFAKKVERQEGEVTVTSAEKIMFIYQKLNTAKFGDDPQDYGINELIRRRIVDTAYPLHDVDGDPLKSEPISDRK